MNRIEQKLNTMKSSGKNALIAYVACGDGGYDATEMAVLQMVKAGADIIELGVPFSDQILVCSDIQDASTRSLACDTTIAGIFELVKRLRKQIDVPLVFVLYLNLIYSFGKKRFFDICSEIGIDGVIIPDMPYEERDEVQPFADENNIIPISVISDTSGKRISKIASDARGYIYCTLSKGSSYENVKTLVDEVKKYTDCPCAVCADISDSYKIRDIKDFCDGIIVGSSYVNKIAKDPESITSRVYDFTVFIRKELDSI